MADTETNVAPEGEGTGKKSKKPLIVGLVMAALGAGGGMFAVDAGLIPGVGAKNPTTDTHAAEGDHGDGSAIPGLPADDAIAFLPVPPLVISLGPRGRNTHLRFVAQLEVDASHQGEVEHLMPRVLDVLNGYLRAVDVAELEEPTALIRLRAQMLRRVQVVTGEGRIRDLLVSEFVLN